MSFDPATGRLYAGDVGQDRVEEIDVIERGGNYGWNYREGDLAGFRTPPAGLEFIEPIAVYRHGSGPFQGNSVTGGVVYRGARLSQLAGAYVFADYVSGNIWSLRYDGTAAEPLEHLANDKGIAAFGLDPRNGDLLLADQGEGMLKRLVYSEIVSGGPIPESLAETGAFADLTTLTPHAGIVPYEVNVSFWSDNARKQRWFSVPDVDRTIEFSREGNWGTPPGTVWIKHFTLETIRGVPESARRLETRFLVRNEQGVYGVTYRWDDSQASAALVPEGGFEESFSIDEGGTVRTQLWRYPSRAECLSCHTPAGGYALSFNTAQLNRDSAAGPETQNQIGALSAAGYFGVPVTGIHTLLALVPADNVEAGREYRVRSYLSANCAQCHQAGGGAVGLFDARFSVPLSQTGLIDGTLNDNLGDPDSRVITPGSLECSMLYQRVAHLGPRHMPPLATSVLDTDAIALLGAWITEDLPRYESFSAWQARFFPSPTAPGAGPDEDPDADHATNWLEYLTGTDPLDGTEAWAIETRAAEGKVQIVFHRAADRGFRIETTTDLTDPASWVPLDLPANRPFFYATAAEAVVEDLPGASSPWKFYRGAAWEP